MNCITNWLTDWLTEPGGNVERKGWRSLPLFLSPIPPPPFPSLWHCEYLQCLVYISVYVCVCAITPWHSLLYSLWPFPGIVFRYISSTVPLCVSLLNGTAFGTVFGTVCLASVALHWPLAWVNVFFSSHYIYPWHFLCGTPSFPVSVCIPSITLGLTHWHSFSGIVPHLLLSL